MIEEKKQDIAGRVAENEKMQTIKTWRGNEINLFEGPRVEDIDIMDIAHHLAMQCRFVGACDKFYSIAEHSIYVALMGPPLIRPYLLLHDAAEYITHDLSKPLKNLISVNSTAYDDLSRKVDVAIMKRFGLSIVKFDQIYLDIKTLDLQVYDYERRFINDVGNNLPEGHPLHGMPFGMTWQEAKSAFLTMFEQLELTIND